MWGMGLVFAALLAAVPPLSERQRAQLETAEDGSRQLDGGALYPLLENASEWEASPEAGAVVLDYERLTEAPREHRGQRVLIEGRFWGSEPMGRLARPGPWSEKARLWRVVVQREPLRAAVVVLVDPPDEPLRRSEVRLAARFYKIWRTESGDGKMRAFPVFVGRSARVERFVSAPSLSAGTGAALLVALIVVLLGVYVLVRRKVNRAVSAPRRMRPSVAEELDEAEAAAEQEGPPLPHDPAEALGELRRRSAPRGEAADSASEEGPSS